MTEPTRQARQRCADLTNAISASHYDPEEFSGYEGTWDMIAFARFVQQTSDTMREIVRLLAAPKFCTELALGSYVPSPGAIGDALALARPFILPEPEVDPLVEFCKGYSFKPEEMAKALRAALAKSGKKIMIEEAE